MASISSLGTGANSIATLVDQLIAPEREPVTNLESSKKELGTRLNILTDLKTKLKSLKDMAEDYAATQSLNTLLAKKAESSDSKFFTVSASSSADVGKHSIFINRVASYDTAISQQLNQEGSKLANKSLGVQEFSIEIGDADAVNISVEILETDTNLDGMKKVRDAINESDANASASIVYDTSSTARLVIRNQETGSENSLDLTELNGSNILRKLDILGAGGTRVASTGTDGGYLIGDIADLDASLTIDGIDVVKSQNEITDILPNVTIKLLQAQDVDDVPLTLTVSNDTDKIKTEINDFITKYNEVVTYLNAKTAVDTTTFERGAFAGDFVFSNLKFSLRSLLTSPIEGGDDPNLQFLSQIGVEVDRDGLLSVTDSSKLDETIATNPNAVFHLFGSDDGIGNRFKNLLNTFVSAGGTVDRSKDGVNRQIKSIDTRIDKYEARLEVRRASLMRQYTDLQRTLTMLNSQQSIMQSYANLGAQYGY